MDTQTLTRITTVVPAQRQPATRFADPADYIAGVTITRNRVPCADCGTPDTPWVIKYGDLRKVRTCTDHMNARRAANDVLLLVNRTSR